MKNVKFGEKVMKYRSVSLIIIFAMAGLGMQSGPEAIPNHQLWTTELQQYVSAAGVVNYSAWKQHHEGLDAYLQELQDHPPASSWSRTDKLAYWIKTYNAYTIQLILDHYPLRSIRDIGEPWDKHFIPVGGETYSLNEIENEIIRPTFKEPRIHFAVNCAAKSCPPLLNKAYTSSNLDQLLSQQARRFINDSRFNGLAASSVQLSNIFNWYRVDFEQSGNLIDYLNQYSDTRISSGASISFKDYDWSLNGR